MTGPKILTLDIETFPHEAYVWGMWKEDIPLARLKTPGRVAGVGWKWLNEKDTHYIDLRSPDMIEVVWELMNEAEWVVTYNGASFDLKHLDREFINAGHGPPSPYRSVDLYQAVKRRFNLPSKKLEYVAEFLGAGKKMKSGVNFDLWKGCMAGEEKAMNRMGRYCRRDVKITEGVFLRLRGWVKGLPNVGLYREEDADDEFVCPACGSADLEKRGYAYTDVSKFQQYHCRKCGRWPRDSKRISGVNARGG